MAGGDDVAHRGRSEAEAAVAGDQTKLEDAVQTVAATVAEMVRPLADTDIRIPRSEWTVGEAAAHLAWAQDTFSRIATGAIIPHGDRTRRGLAEANAHVLEVFPERDGARLADLILEGTRSYLQVSAAVPAGFVAQTPMGPMDIDTCTSYMLTHLMMHGWPIARALRKRSPFDADHVELTLAFITHVMPAMLHEPVAGGLTICYEVRFRGGPRLSFMFDEGQLTIAPTPTRSVDCHISADPVAFFLVGTRLTGQWGQIARGRLVTWGRKPWLALRFAGLFSPP